MSRIRDIKRRRRRGGREEEKKKKKRPVLAEAPPTSWGNHGKRRLRHNGRHAIYKNRRVCRGGSRTRMRAVGVWHVQEKVKQEEKKH